METMNEEVNAKAIDFMERAAKADKPFFLWWNTTKMHIFTHLRGGLARKTRLGIYADGLVEHDRQVGEMLDKLAGLPSRGAVSSCPARQPLVKQLDHSKTTQ